MRGGVGCGGRGAIVSWTHALQVMFLGNRSRSPAKAINGLKKMIITDVVYNIFWIFIFYLSVCLFFLQVMLRTIAI